MKKKVIIDCDPGIDDSLALMLAIKSNQFDILGITIVPGNVPSSLGALNASKVLNLMDSLNIPIYIGESKPLVKDLVTAQDTHGEDGLGETYIKPPNIKINNNAEDFIINTLKKEKDVSIIALGPLTNIAKALKKDPSAFKNAKEIISMGGSFLSQGNTTPVAEFNYWVDPDASQFVYQNANIPITMVPLDVTREIILTPNYIEFLNQINNKLSNFIVDITKFYVNFHWKQEKTLGCVINDPLTIAYFLDRNLCSGFYSHVDIVTSGLAIGQTIVDKQDFYKKPKNCFVLNKVNSHKFMEYFLYTLFPEFKEDINLILSNSKYSY